MFGNNQVGLWNGVRNGHKGALNYIFGQYARMPYKYGYKFTANFKQIEDCIQEVFLAYGKKGDLKWNGLPKATLIDNLSKKDHKGNI